MAVAINYGYHLTAGQINRIRAHFLADYTYTDSNGVEQYGIFRECS